jgi:hypothetical protein
MRIITPEIDAYFGTLYSRFDDALKLDGRDASTPDWEPRTADCHNNVDYCVARDSSLRAVRGWFAQPLADGGCRFVAHSVLEDYGRLIDITPINEETRPKFLPHIGTQEEFDRLRVEWADSGPYPFITFLSNDSAGVDDPFMPPYNEDTGD